MMIDTHAHLNHSDFADDLIPVMARAQEVGVEEMLVPGFDLLSSEESVALAANVEELYATVGLHPHSATEFDRELLEQLQELTAKPRVVALGEVGLDFYRNFSPRAAQEQAFRALAELGRELELPLVVHNREADEEVLAVLAECYTPELPVIMHCYSGGRELAEECRRRGYYLGMAGPLTYPRSEELREVAASYPGELLLLETDCPWLPPQTHRGERNEPRWLGEIAATLAQVRGETVEQVMEQTTANARRAFRLPEGEAG